MMSRDGLLMVATVSALLATEAGAQVQQTRRAPEPAVCIDCSGWRTPPAPAYLIRDTTGRMLTLVPPGDTTFYRADRGIVGLIEPRLIADVQVLRDSAAVRALGRGFEHGVVLLTLTDRGAAIWRRHVGGPSIR